MQSSPFIYGTTVSSTSFTNRENDAAKLYNNLTQGINTTIISPRRWGKSSLVEKVMKDISKKEKGVKPIMIDLFSVSSEEEFLQVLAREVIKASSTKWQDWVKSGKDFFKQLVPKLTMGADPTNDFSITFDWNDLVRYKDEILNLPETVGQKKNLHFIICLDEFQNLASFKEYDLLEKKMRANWQRHKKVTYCLYGSKRHMMTDIFNNPSKPFYRFGDIMLLPKIQTEKWVAFIQKSFKKSGKQIDKQGAEAIAKLMKQHSWYVQQLAHYTWQKTTEKAGEKEIMAALQELIYANSPLYQREVEIISSTQLNLLKAVAHGASQLTSAQTMTEFRLGTPRNVSKNRDTLIENDMIHEVDGAYEFLDPAFELWFRKQYLGEEYNSLE